MKIIMYNRNSQINIDDFITLSLLKIGKELNFPIAE